MFSLGWYDVWRGSRQNEPRSRRICRLTADGGQVGMGLTFDMPPIKTNDVPEPGMLTLLAAGLAMAGVRRLKTISASLKDDRPVGARQDKARPVVGMAALD